MLRRLYQEKRLSLPEIGDICDVDPSTIHYHMEKHDIERRDESVDSIPSLYMSTKGYELFKVEVNGESHTVRHHRLIAVAHHGFGELCSKDVHHKSGIPWDNRPDNLEVLSRSEHLRRENSDRREKLSEWGKMGAKASHASN